ncbi:MAG: RdgB/HAM1 family non-canonical purine NTP pyrophosphatase [Candidatus Omnitrophica bacterium]|nr:RdgB/HAM1 family non-canonical purine NTP pyrophosphatase [Candidatus Omnitrophota bacterium]
MEVVVSTRNRNKFKEISRILKNSDIKTLSLDKFPQAPKVKEDASTFEGNASKKALKIARFTGSLTVADDSGLLVDALRGEPGIFSARFAGKGATYEKNNKKLLRLLAGVPKKKRGATFICCVAVADSRGIIGIVKGICRGYISESPVGVCGFGYDPIFVIPKLKKTFAQLPPALKNRISHRAKAFAKAKKAILKYIQKNIKA